MTILKPKTETADTTVSEAAKKSKRKIPKKWLLTAVVLLAAVLLMPQILRGVGPNNSADSIYTTEKTTTRNITKILSGSGSLQPANSYTVVTLIEGEVLSADFEEGDIVEKETILFQVDSSDASTNIEKSQITLNQARRNYENTAEKQYIKAPSSGIVYSLDVRVGDEITQGQTVATIRDSEIMTLKVPFPADDAAGFFVGQSCIVTLDSTFETLTGTVTEISGTDLVAQGNMITRNVTIEVSNPGSLTNTQAATASINGVMCAGNATFTYRAESTVIASTAGTVTAIRIPEGNAVSKDQVILTLGGDILEDQITSASENFRNAELSMENVQDQLENYTITSPISGTIVDKQYKVGDTVSAGKPLCTIYDLSYLEMIMNIDELDIRKVSVGQTVRITADAVEDREYEGVVTRVSVAGTTTNGTTSYPVTIQVNQTDGLLPGMNVEAEIVVAKTFDVLSIPNAAVDRGNVVLITADSPSAVNALERDAPKGYVYVQVETGLCDDDYAEVISGLQEGDTVAYVIETTGSQMGGSPMGGSMSRGGMGGPIGGGFRQ